MEADTAEETASLVKNRILEQAASAVLAQANQLPALLLRLLTEG
jgi:flagellin-like hook-associated protein FlgL